MNTDKKIEVTLLDQNIANAIRQCAAAVGDAVITGRRTCVHCKHFESTMEQCVLAAARPPARVIAFGCPSFAEEVPF